MKIATLNINSINARLPLLTTWLAQQQPDIVLLQEIKTEFNNFPFWDLQMAGYEAKILGQKSYNGVAVLSRTSLSVNNENLPNFIDENARYLEVETTIKDIPYTFSSIYLPNGNPSKSAPLDNSRFEYKLKWMDAFVAHAETLLKSGKNVILAGDFNVMLTPKDVYNPELFANSPLYCSEVWKRLNKLTYLGYNDSFRSLYPLENGYTYWDYGTTAFQNDLGLRIDYIFSSPNMTDKLIDCSVDKKFRALEKSSDHTVLIANFKDE